MPNWSQVLDEIQTQEASLNKRRVSAVDHVRRKYLKKLSLLTARPTIAYYSGWLTNPGLPSIEINDEDKNAFMMAIHKVEKNKGLDLILHTPGGGIAAAESIVDYLRRIFGKDIRAIVPQIAMSAGTMMACACKSIVMAKHSNLGPIDPQINQLPAAAVKKEIERALTEISLDINRLKIWQFILNKYNPTFIGQCEQAVDWSKQFVQNNLETIMFEGDADAPKKAAAIVESLSDIDMTKSHSRHIHLDECISIGLKIEKLEDDKKLQDAVLTVHHCYMHSFGVSGAAKIVENHLGAAMIKAPAV